ncbi:BRD4-interacting chromatin-remodeling complex-associated protein-like [Synchiropus splendidus]|uniref:BRD4-interacting chromatin-remodeling complex-associated protein-like n=1 Tax=Synchiropus splendidus TaxID=270530 RepID=UPI00237DDCF3|nr:BRD4-interacting chromatin-remodeling complex-associated protein-like [Synchiropus splendidus]XP_053709838.1 BRD4-interacting chromatin-remodeling complex-associated protein-like [Synchiropus splendidus]XP_053709839.1 BRD4-interacting chromatin-remodeling complex-associated protein-like [Synchiropus splendidus]XP_053709840.1 BRD4-interacting chromatin-remodeling complex-associated protein-like [Synchiropus splendidus]XP_053709841.1 BRD4-interacting chromatin-remodeling complex-associated pro
MDDEDDRHLLDILGDVDALNDYLHGSNSKSIEEDDVTNAAYGSDTSFFAGDSVHSSSLKDGSSSLGEFGEDGAADSLQLPSSLSFMEEELGTRTSSPGDLDLGGEDQPFDILQKSLLEADITEQTLVQEALLDNQPAPPTLVQAPVSFPSQLVSGGGGSVVATMAPTAVNSGQIQLPNGSAQHIQVLGSFGSSGEVMTLNSFDRTPQIVLRPTGAVAGAAAGGQVFTPQQGQVGLPLKNIPLQNIIIQRGPGGTQTLVKHIQPKPQQPQTVYSLQPAPAVTANTANGPVVVQSQMDLSQANISQGQFLLPNTLAISQTGTIHNGPADPNLMTSQNTVQIIAGQNFTAQPGGQLILNQGVVSTGQMSVTPTWTRVSCAGNTPVQTTSAPGRLTLVGPPTGAQVTGSAVQRLLVTQTPNCMSLTQLSGAQDQTSPGTALKQNQQGQIMNESSSQVGAQKRPAPSPLTKGGLVLQHLRSDHVHVDCPGRHQFSSVSDALQRLLPYHVFQGAPPDEDQFSEVDEEFELVATQVLARTQAMVNKYRRLLLVEAERSSPSSEIVMIDRTFNQEERSSLTQEKRLVLVDPDAFLDEFCCGVKSKQFQAPSPPPKSSGTRDSQSGSGEPDRGTRLRISLPKIKRRSERPQVHTSPGSDHSQTSAPSPPIKPPQSQTSSPEPTGPSDTDSALEAAVNSILQC